MTENKRKIQRLTLAAFFVAIELLMAFTPIGYIPVGAISITTMHLPVILAGVVLGPSYGAALGGVFGLTSVLNATFRPGLTSFCFTPFVTIGGVQGNFWSLFIAFVPRIFLGWFSGVLYRFLLKRNVNVVTSGAITAALNTLIHTLFVMGSIWLFFGSQYAGAAGIGVGAVIITVLTSNGILEILLAAVVIPALVRALHPVVSRMSLA
jgi:uncharacterized membrane protein